MMRRVVLASACALAGCGLSERAYVERRDWPLAVPNPRPPSPRPPSPRPLAPRADGRVLLVRAIRAGPGLDDRGLQTIQPDGSVRVSFYEEWAAPPAAAVEDALRQWLAASGLFAAVVAPGSRAPADLVLEGELNALWTRTAPALAHTALAINVVRPAALGAMVLLATTFSADAVLTDPMPPGQVQAMQAALANVFGQITAALAVYS